MVETTKTKKFRLHIESGERSWLKESRMKSRKVFNQTIEMKDKGFSRTRIQQNIEVDDFLANNKCAVVGKGLQTWSSYQELLSKWWSFDDREDKPKPNPPDTDKQSAFPLVMAYREGYNLWSNDDGRVEFRITPKPYKKVKGHLRGKRTDLELLKKAIDGDDDYSLGQAELLYREGVYYLHVPIQQEVTVRDKRDSETIVGVDINERNISVTALDRETLDTKGTLVLDYGDVKRVRQELHDIHRRCQEHDKPSIRDKYRNKEGNYTNWVLHRLSRIVVEFSQRFSKPVIVFEDMTDIRDEIEYGTYMNRRLHRLPFGEFEDMVEYKANWVGIPKTEVESWSNSKRCSCCGEEGSRRGLRFTCRNEDCSLSQDHADRNASVNVAWRFKARMDLDVDVELAEDDGYNDVLNKFSDEDGNYRTHKTVPCVRKVSLCGSGRSVNRPASSTDIVSVGVLS